MFSYLQSKFTLPLFLKTRENPQLSAYLTEQYKQKKHVELSGENLVDLKRQVLDWTQSIRVPLVWLQFDSLDVDPGRFWTVLVYGIRKHYPTWGKSLLSGIMDHHASPNPQIFNQFKNELTGKPFILILSDCQMIRQGIVSKQLLSLLEAFSAESMLIFLHNKNEKLFEGDLKYLSRLTVETQNDPEIEKDSLPINRNLLSILDSWWLSWLKRADILINPDLTDYLISTGQIDFLSNEVVKPNQKIRTWLRDLSTPIDYETMAENIRDMTDWLINQGEWLEAYRWLLFIKDFESAGELLESHGLQWLTNGGDALTLLFWLRELPSVLLNARPLPAFLAAKAAFQLGLTTQAQFYLTTVENNLEAMLRFSRSNQQLSDIQITDGGLTFQQMKYLVQDLKEKM